MQKMFFSTLINTVDLRTSDIWTYICMYEVLLYPFFCFFPLFFTLLTLFLWYFDVNCAGRRLNRILYRVTPPPPSRYMYMYTRPGIHSFKNIHKSSTFFLVDCITFSFLIFRKINLHELVKWIFNLIFRLCDIRYITGLYLG